MNNNEGGKMKKILLLALLGVFLAAPVASYAVNFRDADQESKDNPFSKKKCDDMTTLTKCRK